MTIYVRQFASRDEAHDRMLVLNRAARDGSVYCLVDGPENDYAVVDLRTAIDLGGPYKWAR